MSHAMYVGGFANGRSAAERVGVALESYYEHIEVFSYSDFVNHPEWVRNAAESADVFLHSAGNLALRDLSLVCNRVVMLNPPLPTRIPILMLRSTQKTIRMFLPSGNVTVADAFGYSRSAVAELVTHAFANISKLNEISRFHAVNAAGVSQNQGVRTDIVWTLNDAMFQPTRDDIKLASELGVPVTMLDGEHDAVVLHPQEFIAKLLNTIG